MGSGLGPLQREILDDLASCWVEERPELWHLRVPDGYDPLSPFEPTSRSNYRRAIHSLAARGLVEVAYFFAWAEGRGGYQAHLVQRLTLTKEDRASARNLALQYWNRAVEYAELHQELNIVLWRDSPELKEWKQLYDDSRSWVEEYESVDGIPATDPFLMDYSHGNPCGSTNHKTRTVIDNYLRNRRQVINSRSAPPRQHIGQTRQPGAAFTLGPWEPESVTPRVISNLGEKYGSEGLVFLARHWW